MTGRPKPKLRHLYRLRAYSIENILINEPAILGLGLSGNPTVNGSALQALLNFPGWMSNLTGNIAPLFHLYAVAFQLDSSIKTVSRPLDNLYEDTPAGVIISRLKVRKLMLMVSREICRSVGLAAFSETLLKTRKICSGIAPSMYVAGKDYILPLLRIWIQQTLSLRFSLEQLKVQLACHWSPSAEPYLARRVRAVAG
jgi:hypothetical protein